MCLHHFFKLPCYTKGVLKIAHHLDLAVCLQSEQLLKPFIFKYPEYHLDELCHLPFSSEPKGMKNWKLWQLTFRKNPGFLVWLGREC